MNLENWLELKKIENARNWKKNELSEKGIEKMNWIKGGGIKKWKETIIFYYKLVVAR